MAYIHHLSVSKSSPEMSGPCVFCQQEYTIPFASQKHLHECLTDYIIYSKPIQEAFPQHSADQREFMISGICPTCWNSTFDKEEPEDEYTESNEIVLTSIQEIEEFPEVDDFADIHEIENDDDYFLPTEFPKDE